MIVTVQTLGDCPVCHACCWACCDDAPGPDTAVSCKICHTTILVEENLDDFERTAE